MSGYINNRPTDKTIQNFLDWLHKNDMNIYHSCTEAGCEDIVDVAAIVEVYEDNKRDEYECSSCTKTVNKHILESGVCLYCRTDE